MSSKLDAPRGLNYDPVGESSVRIKWLKSSQDDVIYQIRGGGSPIIRETTSTQTIVKGLRPSRHSQFDVRVKRGNHTSEWKSIDVRPSTPIPIAPLDNVGVIQVIDADRQSVQMRLPTPDGSDQDVKLLLWWSPSDNSWWGGLESPVNTPVVRSRSLGLNVGLLDDTPGILAGNIVMRATQEGGEIEPNRRSFIEQSHELRWEPA